MIKNYFDITVGNLARMEETGRVNQFKKWYNFLPTIIFIKKIKALILDTYKIINDKEFEKLDDEVEDTYFKEKKSEIDKLKCLDIIVVNNLGNRVYLNHLKSKVRSKKLDKIQDNTDNLRFALEQIFELTGEKIETEADYLRFQQDVLQLLVDKYQDMKSKHEPKQETDKKTGILDYVISYMNYLSMNSIEVEKLRVHTFVKYRNLANEQSKREKEAIDKNKV
jgi:hypothetical protein